MGKRLYELLVEVFEFRVPELGPVVSSQVFATRVPTYLLRIFIGPPWVIVSRVHSVVPGWASLRWVVARSLHKRLIGPRRRR
jgi:hypothetical protein